VDIEKTISLVQKAKGTRSMRAFADDMGVNVSVISRIISGKTIELSPGLVSKIAVYADLRSGVTLDQLMDAQGFSLSESGALRSQVFEEDFRRIITYELLVRGHSIGKCDIHDGLSPFDFTLSSDALSDEPGTNEAWAFEIMTSSGGHPMLRRVKERLNMIMAEYYKGYPARRITLVTESKLVFDSAKETLAPLTIPNEISVMLVSTAEKQILDEFIAPLNNGRQGRSVFALPESERENEP
jgi:hypothetical protein